MSAIKLKEFRAQWREQHLNVAKEIARVAADPTLKAVMEMDRQMRTHPYFKDIDYRKIETHEPFVFYVQRPSKDSATYHDQIAGKFAPWLDAVKRSFENKFQEPLDWKLADGHGRYGIAVLNSNGSYDNFSQAQGSGSMEGVRAHYEPDIRLAVTYEDTFSIERGNEEMALHTIMHEFVHALQHACFGGSKVDMPRPVWFNEGLAEYLSAPSGSSPQSVARRGVHESRLNNFVAMLHTSELAAFCLPVAELVACDGPGYGSVVKALSRRGVPARDDRAVSIGLSGFYAESTMLVISSMRLRTASVGRPS